MSIYPVRIGKVLVIRRLSLNVLPAAVAPPTRNYLDVVLHAVGIEGPTRNFFDLLGYGQVAGGAEVRGGLGVDHACLEEGTVARGRANGVVAEFLFGFVRDHIALHWRLMTHLLVVPRHHRNIFIMGHPGTYLGTLALQNVAIVSG